MKVRVKATGEVVCVPNSPTVQLLIKTGQVEPVNEPQQPIAPRQTAAPQYVPPKTPAHFAVVEEYRTGNYVIAWRCDECKQSGHFVGVKPDRVHLLRVWHCGHEGGEHVPAEVAARYILINKPAAAMFFNLPQPAPDYVFDKNDKNVMEAAHNRLDMERGGRPVPSEGPSLAEAVAAYEKSLKEDGEAWSKPSPQPTGKVD